MELMFNVEGMMCGGCENRIKNALMTIEGIEKVEADVDVKKFLFHLLDGQKIEKTFHFERTNIMAA